MPIEYGTAMPEAGGWSKFPGRDYALRQHFHHHAAAYPSPKHPDIIRTSPG